MNPWLLLATGWALATALMAVLWAIQRVRGDAGIVESYISYLRRKLDQFSEEPVIQTKRGFGYMLKATKA